MMMFAVAGQATLFNCDVAGLQSLTVESNYTYSVAVNGQPWYTGGKYTIRANGRFYDSEDGSLVNLGGNVSSGSDALGAYTAYTIAWTFSGSRLYTSFMCYNSTLVFRATTVDGATNTSTDGLPQDPPPAFEAQGVQRAAAKGRPGRSDGGSANGRLGGWSEFNSTTYPSIHFPSFVLMPYTLLGGQLGFLEWAGRFTNDGTSRGTALVGFNGGQTGGPLVVFDNTFVPTNNLTGGPASSSSRVAGSQGLRGSSKPLSTILAPLTSQKTAIMGIVQDHLHMGQLWRLAAGPQGHVTSFPAGYSYSFCLTPSVAGINDVTYQYGRVMRTYYGLQRMANKPASYASAETDPLSYKLSYWTDNGGYYYAGYDYNASDNRDAEQVLTRLHDYHQAAGIPVATYQLDPWWYPQPDGLCNNWTAAGGNYFPNGLQPLLDRGMSFVLYSSFWEWNNTINTMPFPWIASEYLDISWFPGHYMGAVSADASFAFYDLLMKRGLGWGMKGFEVDFADFLYLTFSVNNANATAAGVYFQGMGDAALANGVPVQLCMDLPNDVTSSASMPAVTNARASEDDFPTNDGRWAIGLTSMLYGALDLKPFYDDFWTTSVQDASDNPYGPDDAENFTELSAIVSVLSTGPVGISDGLGFTNTSLVGMTCRPDGLLLKPSVPAAPIDGQFSVVHGAANTGEIWAAPAYIPTSPDTAYPANPRAGSLDAATAYPFVSILAVDVTAPFRVYPQDLSPDLTVQSASQLVSDLTVPGAQGPETEMHGQAPLADPSAVVDYVYVSWSAGMAAVQAACADGATAASCAQPFGPTAPITVHTGGENSDHSKPHELYHLSPLYGNGYALVGELAKIVRVSVQRFAWVQPGTASSGQPSLTMAVNGTAGEQVVLTILVPPGSGSSAAPAVGTVAPGDAPAPVAVRHDSGQHGQDGHQQGLTVTEDSQANIQTTALANAPGVVAGTMKTVLVPFPVTAQHLVTCMGAGSAAACTVA